MGREKERLRMGSVFPERVLIEMSGHLKVGGSPKAEALLFQSCVMSPLEDGETIEKELT